MSLQKQCSHVANSINSEAEGLFKETTDEATTAATQNNHEQEVETSNQTTNEGAGTGESNG